MIDIPLPFLTKDHNRLLLIQVICKGIQNREHRELVINI